MLVFMLRNVMVALIGVCWGALIRFVWVIDVIVGVTYIDVVCYY